MTPYFFDEYIAELSELYDIPSPAKLDYMRELSKSVSSNVFFRELKSRESLYRVEKKLLVDESIKSYLEKLIRESLIDIVELNRKLLVSQPDKIFILFKSNHFTFERITRAELTITSILGIRNNNTLVFNTATDKCIHLLLRWKNHAGILGPAWQIKLVKCK